MNVCRVPRSYLRDKKPKRFTYSDSNMVRCLFSSLETQNNCALHDSKEKHRNLGVIRDLN